MTEQKQTQVVEVRFECELCNTAWDDHMEINAKLAKCPKCGSSDGYHRRIHRRWQTILREEVTDRLVALKPPPIYRGAKADVWLRGVLDANRAMQKLCQERGL